MQRNKIIEDKKDFTPRQREGKVFFTDNFTNAQPISPLFYTHWGHSP